MSGCLAAVDAFVASTDPAWFEFLSPQPDVDEVNFWRPNPWGGRFRVLRRGEPLLFKLRAPFNHIAGGGSFEHYTELPISVAWDGVRDKERRRFAGGGPAQHRQPSERPAAAVGGLHDRLHPSR
jgi:hypothetical protein